MYTYKAVKWRQAKAKMARLRLPVGTTSYKQRKYNLKRVFNEFSDGDDDDDDDDDGDESICSLECGWGRKVGNTSVEIASLVVSTMRLAAF